MIEGRTLFLRSISLLICISRSYSTMIESFYNSVNFHNYTMELSTRPWWQLFTVPFSGPAILQSLPNLFYQHPIKYKAFSLDFSGTRCCAEDKHLRKHDLLATTGDPKCASESWERSRRWIGWEWKMISINFICLISIVVIGVSFYDCYLIYQACTRLPWNSAKDGGGRNGSRNSSPQPPSQPPLMIYAGLFTPLNWK